MKKAECLATFKGEALQKQMKLISTALQRLPTYATPVSQQSVVCTSSCSKETILADKSKHLAKDMRWFRLTTKAHRAGQCDKNVIYSRFKGRNATTICDPAYIQAKGKRLCKDNEAIVCASSPMTNTTKRKHISSDARDQGVCLLNFRSWMLNNTARGIINEVGRPS